MEGFLLGLANGGICFAYCAPPLVPYLMGTAKPVRSGYGALVMFLSGRLAGYLAFAAIAWMTHRLVLDRLTGNWALAGLCYLLLATALFCFSWGARFWSREKTCAAGSSHRLIAALGGAAPWTVPALLGLFTGLNICPPFLVAFARAANYTEFLQTALFFMAFFVGTSIFLVPLPFLGLFRKISSWQTIGRLSALVVAGFYFYKALIAFAGGALI
jgi:sulfite exporter TauE/SafE